MPVLEDPTDEWEVSKQQRIMEMNRLAIDSLNQLAPSTSDEQSVQMEFCEVFSREVFVKILKPFIAEKLHPKIEEIVQMFLGQLKLVQDVSNLQMEKLLELIHERILKAIMAVDKEKLRAYEEWTDADNVSTDSLEFDPQGDIFEEGMKRPQPWIIENLVSMLEKDQSIENLGGEEAQNLIAFLKNELLDIIESPYFKSTLVESLQASYEYALNFHLVNHMFESEDEDLIYLKLMKIVTSMYHSVVQQSDDPASNMLGMKLRKSFLAKGNPDGLALKQHCLKQLVKYVFFED